VDADSCIGELISPVRTTMPLKCVFSSLRNRSWPPCKDHFPLFVIASYLHPHNRRRHALFFPSVPPFLADSRSSRVFSPLPLLLPRDPTKVNPSRFSSLTLEVCVHFPVPTPPPPNPYRLVLTTLCLFLCKDAPFLTDFPATPFFSRFFTYVVPCFYL